MNDQLEERVLARTAELMQANQRLAEANAAKDRFLATLSHELRTPLTPLRAGIDLLRTRLPDGEWQAILATPWNATSAQETRLINDLLDVARITAGKLSLEKRAVDLGECMRNAVEMIEPRAAAKNQVISLEPRDAFPTLLADPVRLQQVVANLLDNAVKFSPVQGHIRVAAWLAENQVVVEVADSGPGTRSGSSRPCLRAVLAGGFDFTTPVRRHRFGTGDRARDRLVARWRTACG